MRKALLLPGFAAAVGAAGFLVRRWQLATAFEPETGLPIPGAPSGWLLLALTLLTGGVLLAFSAGLRGSCPGGYARAFSAEGNAPYAGAVIAAALLAGVSGVLQLLELPVVIAQLTLTETGSRALMAAVPRVLLALLSLVASGCLMRTAKHNYRAEGRGTRAVWLLGPPFCCCLWLVAVYQVRAADPVLADYAYQIFAIIAALLALYSMAGFSFEKPKPARTVFFSLAGAYLSIIALADSLSLSFRLLYAFAAVYLLASAAVLLDNAEHPHSPEGGTAPYEP